jgi:hypothetical protein
MYKKFGLVVLNGDGLDLVWNYISFTLFVKMTKIISFKSSKKLV